MIKTKEMDKFIKEYMKIYLHNPELPIVGDTLYRALECYDFSEKDFENGYINDIFPELERIFANSNLRVYVDDRQKGFLQFTNNSSEPKSVKMYLSFPKEYIGQAAFKIFKYISDNNMSCSSKLSQRVRSDAIVVRLQNAEDAKKLLQFVNSDRDLLKYHKSSNPFSLKEGIVGVGYDDMLSYNSVLSKLLANYYSELRNADSLKKASLKSFANYVENIYNKTFITKENLVEFTYSDIYKEFNGRLNSPGALLNNLEQVIRIIKNVTNNSLDKNLFFNMYDQFKNDSENKKYFAQEYSKRLGQIQKSLLDSYIEYAISKYGIDNVHLYLEAYINGNINAITNDNNFRQYFEKYMAFDDVEFMVSNNPKQYIDKYVSNKINESNDTEKLDTNYSLFVTACSATAQKYGNKQAIAAIKKALDGNYKYFTNDGEKNYRSKLKELVPPTEIIRILNKTVTNQEITISYDMLIFNFVEGICGDKIFENRTQRL